MKKYNLAKDYYLAQQYPQALKYFKELTTRHEKNAFDTYAYFYCALVLNKQEKYKQSQEQLERILTKFPNWDKKEDVYYLLADVSFKLQDWEKALANVDKIQSKKLTPKAQSMKLHYLQKLEGIEVLKDLEHDHRDENIAKLLARKLDKKYNNIEERLLLEYLIQDYKLNRDDYPYGTFPSNKKKEEYNVAVLLPFMIHQPKAYRKFARFYELYQGIRLATDSLLAEGILLNLYVYDTQKDTAKVHELLNNPEMQEMDLFIGPIYQNTSRIMKQYSTLHHINYVNPLQGNGEFIHETEQVFLSKSSNEVKGKSFAEYSNVEFENRDVLVFYGGKEKDSVLAHSYIAHLDSINKRVVSFKKITRENVIDIRKIVSSADKESLSHIFITSSENLAAATLMSTLESKDINVPVIAPSKWLTIGVLEYEQLRRHQFYFDYEDYVDVMDTLVQHFRTSFKEKMNLKPMVYSKQADPYYGYESMYFFGKMLFKHGNLFNKAIRNEGYHKGSLLKGMQYELTNANNIAPLLRFNEYYELEWVNFPHYQEIAKYEKDNE